MREYISIHIGQAGLQLGSACWELYCLEHGIQPDGRLSSDKGGDDSFNSFFGETGSGKHVPRAIFVDADDTAINAIRNGPYRQLFGDDSLTPGNESSVLYSMGYKTPTSDILSISLDGIKKAAEQCSDLQGFLIFHGVGGGTGSGLTSKLMEVLSNIYGSKMKMTFSVYPTPQLSDDIVDPYHAVLSTHSLLQHSDCTFVIDNEAVYNISRDLGIESPRFANLNHVIAQVVSSVTLPLRSNGTLNVDLKEIQANLVPHPRIKFPIASYAPIVKKGGVEASSISDITNACFNPNNQMVRCDPSRATFMACCLQYRGDISPTDVNNAVQSLNTKETVRFADWSPRNFKFGINAKAPSSSAGSDLAEVERAVCMLSNNTGIAEAWDRLRRKFDLLYAKRAYLHYYAPLMDIRQFGEARENLASLEEDYKKIDAGSFDPAS